MIPDKAKAVLRDYRAGKATSATELAKLHGVSRSAVYRLLKKEVEAPKVEAAKVGAREQPQENESTSLMQDLYSKAESFANSLGLPDQAGEVKHEEVKDEKAEQEKEEQLSALMDAMMGEPPQGLSITPGLEAAINGGEPRQIREAVEYRQPPRVEVPRAEVTQKIIFNIQHFGPQLEVITGPNREAFIQTLAQMPLSQLKETLSILERTRSVGNIASGFKHVFYVAGQATETASQFMGMSTQGFTNQLRAQDEEVTMIMKELAIEQWERLKVMDSPQMRLGMLFCMTLIQVDTRNKLEEHFKRSNVPDHIARSTEDL